MKITLQLLIASLICLGSAGAGDLWDKTKSVAGKTVEVVGDTAQKVGDAVTGEEDSPAKLRAEIDQAAAATIAHLTAQNTTAKQRFDSAQAYAVFDTRKISLLITTGFGSGVAVAKDSGAKTYMKMATGGVNVGAGIQSYRVIFLFPDQASYKDFVLNGWSADAEATAAANEDKADTALRLTNGVFVYKQDEKGVALSATLAGTRYWKDDDLNK